MTFTPTGRDTPLVRTQYRISDMYAHSLTGNVAQGSYTDSATDSGYISVSHGLGGTPRSCSGRLVLTAGGAGRPLYCNLKGIGATYLTFLVHSGADPVMTGSDITVVWVAHL